MSFRISTGYHDVHTSPPQAVDMQLGPAPLQPEVPCSRRPLCRRPTGECNASNLRDNETDERSTAETTRAETDDLGQPTGTLTSLPDAVYESDDDLHVGYPEIESQRTSEETTDPVQMASFEYTTEVPSFEEDAPSSWLQVKLSGLTPTDFHPQGAVLILLEDLRVPAEFQKSSIIVDSERLAQGGLKESENELIRRSGAILVMCDIQSVDEVQSLLMLDQRLQAEQKDAPPPLIVVPHANWMHHSPLTSEEKAELELHTLVAIYNDRADCVIPLDSCGFELACQVRSALMSFHRKLRWFDSEADALRHKVAHINWIEQRFEDGFWRYCVARLHTGIPLTDTKIPECKTGATIGKFTIGSECGQGGNGSKYFSLEDASGGKLGQAMKTMSKEAHATLQGLKKLRSEINAMNKLSEPEWRHPNIAQLYEVYHSETQILFRVQDGGASDLFECLHHYERSSSTTLGRVKADKIVTQCLSAVSHMHLGPHVVHGDIKLESIAVKDTEQDIHIMLCDFDLARVVSQSSCFRTSVTGTFPFTAPEIVSGAPYQALPADIWSLGIVFLKVFCFCGVLRRHLSLPSIHHNDANRHLKESSMICIIRDYFSQPQGVSEMIQRFHAPGLGDEGQIMLLQGMLTVTVSNRLTAADLKQLLESWQ